LASNAATATGCALLHQRDCLVQSQCACYLLTTQHYSTPTGCLWSRSLENADLASPGPITTHHAVAHRNPCCYMLVSMISWLRLSLRQVESACATSKHPSRRHCCWLIPWTLERHSHAVSHHTPAQHRAATHGWRTASNEIGAGVGCEVLIPSKQRKNLIRPPSGNPWFLAGGFKASRGFWQPLPEPPCFRSPSLVGNQSLLRPGLATLKQQRAANVCIGR
jgi:hypothetical protein